MRENCLKQFDEHWNCMEANNQVTLHHLRRPLLRLTERVQEYFRCRKPERTLNKCMFEKLVRLFLLFRAQSCLFNCRQRTGLDQNNSGFAIWPETNPRGREPSFYRSAEVDNYIDRVTSYLRPLLYCKSVIFCGRL